MLPIECIVRGYLSGSAWKEYQRRRARCTAPRCPTGCRSRTSCPSRCSRRRPRRRSAITTRTSAFERAVDLVGRETWPSEARERQPRAATSGARRGPPSAGSSSPTPSSSSASSTASSSLCDEVLTPDSSRFWPADEWKPGTTPPIVRQAAGARLPRRPRLGQEAAAAAAARRGRQRVGDALRRGVRAHHRFVARCVAGRVTSDP